MLDGRSFERVSRFVFCPSVFSCLVPLADCIDEGGDLLDEGGLRRLSVVDRFAGDPSVRSLLELLMDDLAEGGVWWASGVTRFAGDPSVLGLLALLTILPDGVDGVVCC